MPGKETEDMKQGVRGRSEKIRGEREKRKGGEGRGEAGKTDGAGHIQPR